MILYVNGDSHTAAGEAVNDYCFAEDDPKLWAYGRAPHPDNLAVSWGQRLADMIGATLHCDAESASSNERIYRTTEEYLAHHKPQLVVIGWSTWEREEWHYGEQRIQVSAGGPGHDWPDEIKDQYRKWVLGIDYQKKMNKANRSIHNFHRKLQEQGIPHYFFTCYEPCTGVEQLDFGDHYLEPYNRDFTFYNWCKNQGFKTVKQNSYHFGADAHQAWADFLYPKIIKSCLTAK